MDEVRTMKRIITLLSAVITAVLMVFLPVSAADSAGNVRDDYGILSSAELAKLNEIAASVSDQYGVGTYIRVVNGTEGMNIESYAEYLYNAEDMGLGAERDGILLIIDMKDHYYDIAAYGSTANQQFTDYRKDQMAKNFLEDLSSGYYYNAFRTFLEDCDYYLRTEVIIYKPTPRTVSDYAGFFAFPPIAALITVLLQRRRNKTRGIRTTAEAYIPQGGVNLTNMIDMYLYREVHRAPIPKVEVSSGGGHETGHTTINSHGFSHHSGKF